MSDNISGAITRIFNKMHKQKGALSQDEKKKLITPEVTAEVLQKLQNSWDDVEEDKKILHRFIDEWVDMHANDSV